MAKRAEAVTIIGGADGPTSVFLVGRTKKRKKLKYRIRDYFYKKKQSRIEKMITANPHTLQEVAAYIVSQYGGVELSGDKWVVREEKNSLKASLVLEHRPDLLGALAKVEKPKNHTKEALTEFIHQTELRQEAAEQLPEDVFAMDFHVYEIQTLQGSIRVSIETVWEAFGVSYSGSKKEMKRLKRIVKDLYCYYGVTENDILSRSKRCHALIMALCE